MIINREQYPQTSTLKVGEQVHPNRQRNTLRPQHLIEEIELVTAMPTAPLPRSASTVIQSLRNELDVTEGIQATQIHHHGSTRAVENFSAATKRIATSGNRRHLPQYYAFAAHLS